MKREKAIEVLKSIQEAAAEGYRKAQTSATRERWNDRHRLVSLLLGSPYLDRAIGLSAAEEVAPKIEEPKRIPISVWQSLAEQRLGEINELKARIEELERERPVLPSEVVAKEVRPS